MAHYFFHTADGTRDRDTSGMDLDDDAAARREGIRYAGSILASEPELLADSADFRVEVTDQAQRLLFTIIALAVDAPRFEEGD